MKVKELVKILKEFDQELNIYLQKDSEGNGYEELYGADDECLMVGEDVFGLNWSADEACMEEDEWEDMKRSNDRVVILYP